MTGTIHDYFHLYLRKGKHRDHSPNECQSLNSNPDHLVLTPATHCLLQDLLIPQFWTQRDKTLLNINQADFGIGDMEREETWKTLQKQEKDF